MKNSQKYRKGYFLPPQMSMKWAQKNSIDKAPIWCSVDLRDGNQALIIPMSIDEKLAFFQFLVDLGFKEIEVGFPAASETEFMFLRALIERDLIPNDVTVQVLTQSREHIIKRTFEALNGVKQAVVHLYNSTSVAQREQVFRKSKDQIKKIAADGAELLKKYAAETPGNFRFEYSPESFTGTEIEYALEVCNEVLDVWKPTSDKKVIINLPATVSMSMSHVYASQIEYMCGHLKYRENVIVSLHPHNDRGCGVADAEMGLLAGADRIEGTLFGNGERTGNVDIITLALNMYSQGIEPGLDFTDMPRIVESYENWTHMRVHDRQPYAGKLVFAAFSGSHQDAIAKGMKWREQNNIDYWSVPYLPIDPKDVGREYESDVIRINSQSGKGGIGYLLEQNYGYDLPKQMREEFSYKIKDVSDHQHKELHPDEIYKIFKNEYVNIDTPIALKECHFIQHGNEIEANISLDISGRTEVLNGMGNGRLDAVSNALQKLLGLTFAKLEYAEHALEKGSKAKAVAYVGIANGHPAPTWGVGIHSDIINASIIALIGAVNNLK